MFPPKNFCDYCGHRLSTDRFIESFSFFVLRLTFLDIAFILTLIQSLISITSV